MPDDNFNRYCEELLARYTRRNQQAVTRHLESLCNLIRNEGHAVQTMYCSFVSETGSMSGIANGSQATHRTY